MFEGEEVWGSAPGFGIARDGVHAEYVAVPMEVLSLKPRTLSIEQAAAIGVPFTTACSALVRAAEIREGETIVTLHKIRRLLEDRAGMLHLIGRPGARIVLN